MAVAVAVAVAVADRLRLGDVGAVAPAAVTGGRGHGRQPQRGLDSAHD